MDSARAQWQQQFQFSRSPFPQGAKSIRYAESSETRARQNLGLPHHNQSKPNPSNQMIIYATNKKGKRYLINALLTEMEKKAMMALQAAKNRCKNSGCTHFEDYGGRGISVCQRWAESFQAFVDDVGLPHGPEYSIERKNVNGNYEPGNVKWALLPEQHRNRRSTVWVDLPDGRKVTMAEAASIAGVTRAAIWARLKLGWTGVKLLGGRWGTAAENKYEPVTIEGVTKPMVEWAKQIGMSLYGFRSRMKRGLTGKALLAPHKTHNGNPKRPKRKKVDERKPLGP